MNIPNGYCHCGCGQKTNPALKTQKKYGWIKGRPTRFIFGHGARKHPSYVIESRGYITPCWITRNPIVVRDGKRIPTYRYMWELQNGSVPSGLELDHLCKQGFDKRNPGKFCIRPDHLEPVTIRVNSQRGRQAKLNIEQVIEIRAMYDRGLSVRIISKQFLISESQVYRIGSREQWSNI